MGKVTIELDRSDAERLLWLAAREGMIRKSAYHHTPWTSYWAGLAHRLRNQIWTPEAPYELANLTAHGAGRRLDSLEDRPSVAGDHRSS